MFKLPTASEIRNHGLTQSLLILALYSAWSVIFRLLVLSFITYFLSSSSTHPLHFEEINDSFGSNELSVMGISSLLFVMLMKWLHPLTATTGSEIFTIKRFEKSFLPGLLQGAILAVGIVVLFVASGIYRYLGFFIQMDEAPLALTNVIWRVLAVGLFAYSEEFIFRHKIQKELSKHFAPGVAIFLTALFYCAAKAIQFDLGRMQMLTLFGVSIGLSLRTWVEGDFCRGAGFWAAILIVFHPIVSLPIFGDDFSGLLLVKYQGGMAEAAESLGAATRLLVGGVAGPLSSIAFQIVIGLDVLRGLFQNKKTLLKPADKPI